MEKRTGNHARRPRRLAKLLSFTGLLGAAILVAIWWPKIASPVPSEAPVETRTVLQWRERLYSEQSVERAQAVLALAQAQDRESLGAFRTLLASDTAANVRAVVALVLADWKDLMSTEAIMQLLDVSAGVDTQVVLDALTRMGDVRAASVVLAYLDSDDDILRLQAVEALVAMQASAVGPKILRQAQVNQDPAKAKTYAMALGKLQVSGAQDYLLHLARESEPSPTRWASYLALGRLRSTAAIDVLSDAMTAPHDKGRENAQQALISIASARTAPKMWPLLGHAERSVRFAAAEVLVGSEHPNNNAELLRALQRDASQAPAALALGRRKVLAAWEPLQTALAQPQRPDREVLAQAMGWLGDMRAVPLLRQVLAERQGEGRYGAAWALGVLRASVAREDLQRAAAGADSRLALLALDALGQLADPLSAAFLAEHAQSNPEYALAALASLAQVPGDTVRLHLERLAVHRDARLSRAALQALAQRADVAAVPALLDMLDEATADNRSSIRQALTAISGQHWDTPQQWRHWYALQAR